MKLHYAYLETIQIRHQYNMKHFTAQITYAMQHMPLNNRYVNTTDRETDDLP